MKKKELEQYVKNEYLTAIELKNGLRLKGVVLELNEDNLVFKTLSKTATISFDSIAVIMSISQRVKKEIDIVKEGDRDDE